MKWNNRISFLDLEIIKLDNVKIVSNWYRKSTYSGRMLNFISNHPFQNKVAIKNLVDRAVCLSHESFHSENLEVVRKISFFNHYPQDSIKNHIRIRIQQIKNRKSRNVDTDTQSENFDKNNTIVLPYFGQISKTIQSMLKKFQIHKIFGIPFGMEGLITLGKDILNRLEKSGVIYKLICKTFKVTYVRQTGRLLNTWVEEHKKNLGRKCNYHNVLSRHRKEYADHDFDWNYVEILYSESNKGKREFMEMLYIKREGTYSINLKRDLVTNKGYYNSMISYL